MPCDTLLRLFMNTAFRFQQPGLLEPREDKKSEEREEQRRQKRSISTCQNKKETSNKTAYHIK